MCALALLGAMLAACANAPDDAGPSAWPTPGAAPAPLFTSAWDNFNHRGALMWVCRDVASGEVVSNSLCHGLPQVDRQWPGMAVPPGYRGVLLD